MNRKRKRRGRESKTGIVMNEVEFGGEVKGLIYSQFAISTSGRGKRLKCRERREV